MRVRYAHGFGDNWLFVRTQWADHTAKKRCDDMSSKTRKLFGTIVLLVFLTIYIALVAAIGSGRIAEAHGLLQFIYFLVAGLLWVAPAALLMRWMARPD